MDKNCKLIVNGNDISIRNYVKINYERQYAELPLIAIVKVLGAKVEWKSQNKAIIKFHDKDYILDTVKKSLIEDGDSFNIIALPPGTKHGAHYQMIDGEFVVDSDSMCYLIYLMNAKISIDFERSIIKID